MNKYFKMGDEVRCSKCGRVKWGNGPLTGSSGYYCHCNDITDNILARQSITPEPMQGWQCPVCGAVYSPFVQRCENYHGHTITATNNTEITNEP